jgi:hypothetical protein
MGSEGDHGGLPEPMDDPTVGKESMGWRGPLWSGCGISPVDCCRWWEWAGVKDKVGRLKGKWSKAGPGG